MPITTSLMNIAARRRPETVQEDPVQFVGQTDTYFEFNLSPDLKEVLSTLNEDVQEMIMLKCLGTIN